MKYTVLAIALWLAAPGDGPRSVAAADASAFRPGAVWLDTGGRPINAHGGGMLYHEGVYYWYGENKEGRTWLPDSTKAWEGYRVDVTGVRCYSSKDLFQWRDEGLVLKAVPDEPGHDLHPSKVCERPKVIYNRRTGKFVMWMHIDSEDYKAARAGVAVADRPTGPFRYLESVRPEGQMSRDQTLFQDDDGRAYRIYSSENNATTYISLLSDDYLKHAGKFVRVFAGRSMEAPAVFKRGGKYWFIGSGCTGWAPNAARSAVADSIWGPWKELGNPCRGPEAAETFRGQSTFVFPVAGRPDAWIFMADRWNKRDLCDSRYLWLPLRFDPAGRPLVEWKDAWDMTAPARPAAETEKKAKTAIQILQESPKPQFRQGHTLLPLTRWGWTMPLEVRIELAEHWGYALEFGGDTTMAVTKALDDPRSIAAKMCALAASDPKKYPLCVLTCRPLLDRKFLDALPPEAWCRDAKGEIIKAPARQLSPEAPDEIFVKAAKLATEPLVVIRRKAPIAMVLNGGEYGLAVFGWGGKAWQQDPRVLKAKGDRDWFSYISERRSHQEMIISRAVREAVPDRRLFIFYYTSDCPQRGRNQQWDRWTWDYQWMRPVSDLPNISVYYKEFNSGWTGGDDMLTQVLNCIGGHIAAHEPLSYNWLCSGWAQKNMGPEAFSDAEHYMGFLKCYYTAGMVGGVAGFFSYPKGGFVGDVGDKPPSWLQQEMVLGHAQALFSHVEELIREGDLLPGPARHRWTKDRPAYEFPTGDKDSRVVTRRHRGRPEWLIAAWAAAGPDREVAVEIPDLGKVQLLARACGTVYRATLADGKPSLKLLDKDGMQPTVGWK